MEVRILKSKVKSRYEHICCHRDSALFEVQRRSVVLDNLNLRKTSEEKRIGRIMKIRLLVLY